MEAKKQFSKRILVPTDMSAHSLAALQYAQDISHLIGGEIVVLRVIEETGPAKPDQTSEPANEAAAARRALVHLLIDHNVLTQDVRIEIRAGTPEKEIVSAAKDVGADLIVMSTHGRTGLEHVLMGSVTEKVVRYSSVPVLTVKPDRFRGLVDITEDDIADSLHMKPWEGSATN